jgi:hypothetical protein
MEENQRKLALKKREKTTLKPSISHRPVKKGFKSKKVIPKPNPFDALDKLKSVKKKYLTTPKDTRKPRSQFLTGRHMGPK